MDKTAMWLVHMLDKRHISQKHLFKTPDAILCVHLCVHRFISFVLLTDAYVFLRC